MRERREWNWRSGKPLVYGWPPAIPGNPVDLVAVRAKVRFWGHASWFSWRIFWQTRMALCASSWIGAARASQPLDPCDCRNGGSDALSEEGWIRFLGFFWVYVVGCYWKKVVISAKVKQFAFSLFAFSVNQFRPPESGKWFRVLVSMLQFVQPNGGAAST